MSEAARRLVARRRVVAFGALLAAGGVACEPVPASPESGPVLLGSYAATYDAGTRRIEHRFLGDAPWEIVDPPADALTANDNSTGLGACPIQNTATSACSAVVEPANCRAANYNTATQILSVSVSLQNLSNRANDGAPYTYTNPARWPPNSTYLAPFYLVITGFASSTGGAGLLSTLNTNIANSACGSNGLQLTDAADDANGNGNFDCIYPDKAYDASFSGYPGWDLTPWTGSGLAPGAATGCTQFIQFGLTANVNFTFYYDLYAVRSTGSLPPTPVVSSHTDGQYVSANSITLAGDTCTATTGTVYVEGGSTIVSQTCQAGGRFSLSVPMNLNTANHLVVYQKVAGVQSGARILTIHHDNIPPTVVAATPANGDPAASRNANCVLRFSEPLLQTTVTTANFQFRRGTTTITTSATLDQNSTDVIVVPTKPLNASTSHSCRALAAGASDLAGNTLAATFTSTFTTANNTAYYTDTVPPKVLTIVPPDNQSDVSPTTVFTITFSEPVNAATIEGSVVVPYCDISGENIPTVFLFELNNCHPVPPGPAPIPIPGSVVLDALGTTATFIPTNPALMTANNCYGFVVTPCVTDLAGLRMADRGTRTVAAYNGGSFRYNEYNIFYTGAGDSRAPFVAHVGPRLSATGVRASIYPHVVFSEPIDPATLGEIFLSKTGTTNPVPLKVIPDPTMQLFTLQLTSPLSAHNPPISTGNYQVTVTDSLADLSGNVTDIPQTSAFQTGATADTTNLGIAAVSPANGAAVADLCPFVDIFFAEPMRLETLTQASIQLVSNPGGLAKPVDLEVWSDGTRVRLKPLSSLASGGRFDVKVLTSVADRANNLLAAQYLSYFTVGTEAVAPTVAAVVPPSGGTIQTRGSVAVFFSETMDSTTLIAANLTVSTCSGIVNVDPENQWAVINCYDTMPTGAATVRVNTNVRDYYNATADAACEGAAGGNRMAANFSSTFTVAAGTDTTPPTLAALNQVTPQDGTPGVAVTVIPTVTFSEAIDPRSVLPSSVYLMDHQGNVLASTVSFSNNARTLSLRPAMNLPTPGVFYVIVTTAVRDLGGANAYDGNGGELVEVPGVLRTCFSTGTAVCP